MAEERAKTLAELHEIASPALERFGYPADVAVPRPILVTGAHRSGTTWVGAMLTLSPRIGLIHEPFSPITPPGVSSAPFDRFFRYVTAENEGPYVEPFERTARFPVRPAAASCRRSARRARSAERRSDLADFTASRAAQGRGRC